MNAKPRTCYLCTPSRTFRTETMLADHIKASHQTSLGFTNVPWTRKRRGSPSHVNEDHTGKD
jgi:hypothetical protein